MGDYIHYEGGYNHIIGAPYDPLAGHGMVRGGKAIKKKGPRRAPASSAAPPPEPPRAPPPRPSPSRSVERLSAKLARTPAAKGIEAKVLRAWKKKLEAQRRAFYLNAVNDGGVVYAAADGETWHVDAELFAAFDWLIDSYDTPWSTISPP